MSNYVEERAEESDDETSKRTSVVDDEDSEDDDEIDDHYEEDDFIVNDGGEDEDAPDGDEDVGRKRSRNSDGNRPRKKRLKRLKRGRGLEQELQELLDNKPRDEVGAAQHEEGVNYDNEEDPEDARRPSSRGRDSFGEEGVDEYGLDQYGSEEDPEEPQKVTIKDAQDTLKMIYGPDALKEQFLTEEDDYIRNTDAPERLLVRQGLREGEVTDAEQKEEAEWIYEKAFMSRDDPNIQSIPKEAFVTTITQILVYMLKGKLDIPFISLYRREHFEDHLSNDQDLWEIYEWDERWCNLQSKKQNLQDAFRRVRDSNLDESCGFQLHTYEMLLRSADTIEDVNDLYSHYQLHFASKLPNVEETSTSTHKRPVRRDAYSIAKRSTSIQPLVSRFGFTPQDYAENLQVFYAQKPTKDDEERPSILASEFVNREFKNEDSALKAARAILSHEIAHEPVVRKKIRDCYEFNGRMTLKLTQKGESTATKQLHSYKNVYKTPVNEFIRGNQDGLEQFLQIIKDEQNGLVEMIIDVDQDQLDRTLELDSPGVYLSDRSDMLATEWNEQRRYILKDVQSQLQLPMQQYIKNLYTKKGINVIGLKCETKLQDMLMCGPIGHDADKWEPEKIEEDDLDLSDDEDEDDDEDDDGYVKQKKKSHSNRKNNKPARPTKHRILSICPEAESDRITFCMLDADGILLDVIHWNFMPQNVSKIQTMHHENKNQWLNQISMFQHLFNKHAPIDAICICITGMNAVRTREIIEYVLRDLQKNVPLEYVPDHIAKIYESSNRAKKEFPDRPAIVKRAVSIGRLLNDPLTEIAGLFNDQDQDILMYKFHPLQDLLSKELLMQYLEKALVRVVNKVGFDINRVAQHKHLQSTARFVSGWGPRKADHVLKWVSSQPNQIILRRKQLLVIQQPPPTTTTNNTPSIVEKKPSGILDKNVFFDCAGFIKVFLSATQLRAASASSEGMENVTLDVLDNTRIHPENYSLAVQMAVDALDEEGNDQLHLYVERVMDDPSKLDDLDLDAHAEELLKRNYGRKHKTLKSIKAELQCRFKDPRHSFRRLSDNEIFDYVTGETDQTLTRDKLVHAQVIRISERGIKLQLTDNPAIQGFMKLSHLDDHDRFNHVHSREEAIRECKKYNVEEGLVIQCVILEVQKDRYSVLLSMTQRDLQHAQQDANAVMDDITVSSRKEINSSGGRRQEIKRSINHPSFKNFSYQQAMDYLMQQGQVGNVVIRPSSKGYDHLTITYMFFNRQFINLDVIEKEKQDQNSLGRQLLVNQKQYADLDEIVYKCVEMEMEHARKLMQHPKYCDSDAQQIEQLLLREKNENPKTIPYRIGLSDKYPGKFTIYYVPSRKVKEQMVGLVPDGYRYNHRVFKNSTKLLNAFKRSYDGKVAPSSSGSSSSSHRESGGGSSQYGSNGGSSRQPYDSRGRQSTW